MLNVTVCTSFSQKCLMQTRVSLIILSKCLGIYNSIFDNWLHSKDIQTYSTFLLYLLIHNLIFGQVHTFTNQF